MPQIGDHVKISWEPLTEYTGPDGTVSPIRGDVDYYEVRRGTGWTFGRRIYCTPCTSIRTRDWCVGTETYYVAARFKNGRYSSPCAVSVTCVTPDNHTNEDDQDETTVGGGWPGTHSDTTTSGTSLVLAADKTTGTYTSDEIDLGALGTWRLGTMMHAACVNTALTWDGLTWDDTAAITWDEMAETYGSEDYWSWSGAMIQELDWNGNNVYSPTASYTLEYTVYSVSGSPGTFAEYAPGEYYGQFLQFRITLTRADTANETLSVDACSTTWSTPRGGVSTLNELGDVTVATYNVGQALVGNGAGEYVAGTVGLAYGGTNADLSGVAASNLIQMNAGGTAFEDAGATVHAWMPVYNVINYGAVGNGVADDTIAIQAAIDAVDAYTYGGIVYLPPGAYLISETLVLPNRVTLRGGGAFPTRLIADDPFTGSWMVQLGDGLGGNQFHVRVEHINFNASDVAGLGCIYSDQINEQSGVFWCDFNNYTTYGISIDGSVASEITTLKHLAFAPSEDGSSGAIKLDHVSGHNEIRNLTVAGGIGGTHTDGILIYGGVVTIVDVHLEQCTNGIHLDDGAIATVDGVYGHDSVTNLINIDSSVPAVILSNIVGVDSGSNYILVDDFRGVSYTVAAKGMIPFYVRPEITGDVKVGERLGVGIAPTRALQVYNATNCIAVVDSTSVYVGLRTLPAGGTKQMMFWDDGQAFAMGRAADSAGNSMQLDLVFDTSGHVTMANNLTVSGTVKSDTIAEATGDAGVTIETVLLKDGLVDGVDVSAHAGASVEVHGLAAGISVAGTSGATVVDRLAAYDAAGYLVDSGYTAASFATAAHAHSGADITSGTVGLAYGGTNADLSAVGANRLLRMNAGQTALEAVNQTGFIIPSSSNPGTRFYSVQSNDLGSDGTFNLLLPIITATDTIVSKNSIDELRNKNLVDATIKRNGQVAPFATLSSSNQTGAGTVRVPDLGGAGTYDFVFTALTQTLTNKTLTGPSISSPSITGSAVFDEGVVINETGASSDTRIEGDTNAQLFFVDASEDRIGIGTISPAYKFSIASTDASNQIGIIHDNSDAYFRTDDGAFIFQSDEGSNHDTNVDILGLGTGVGELSIYDATGTTYLFATAVAGAGYICVEGTAPGKLGIQDLAPGDVDFFLNTVEGVTREVNVYGFRAGDESRALQIGVGIDAADTASFDGVSNYLFDGDLEADNIEAGDITATGALDWSSEPSIAYVCSGEMTGTTEGEFWFEDNAGSVYCCLHTNGGDYKVQMTAV